MHKTTLQKKPKAQEGRMGIMTHVTAPCCPEALEQLSLLLVYNKKFRQPDQVLLMAQ